MLRYRLSAVLLVISLIAIGLALYSRQRHLDFQYEQQILATINDTPGLDIIYLAEKPRAWDSYLYPDDANNEVATAASVNVHELDFRQHIKLLEGLPHLEELKLVSPACNDSDIALLSGLTKLRAVSFYDTSVSKNGVALLASLCPAVEVIKFSNYNPLIDDDVATALAGFRKLKAVDLTGARRVTAAGIKEIAKLPSIAVIFVDPGLLTPELVNDVKSIRPDVVVRKLL